MSVHIEYMSVKDVSAFYGSEWDVYGAEAPGDNPVLVLSADEMVVLEGTHEELMALWRRIGHVLERGPQPRQNFEDDE